MSLQDLISRFKVRKNGNFSQKMEKTTPPRLTHVSAKPNYESQSDEEEWSAIQS
jgi:hypothetical protein